MIEKRTEKKQKLGSPLTSTSLLAGKPWLALDIMSLYWLEYCYKPPIQNNVNNLINGMLKFMALMSTYLAITAYFSVQKMFS